MIDTKNIKTNKMKREKNTKVVKPSINSKQQWKNLDFSPLALKELRAGQVFLGCIHEVKEYELVIHLPHKLFGFVPVTSISQAYLGLLAEAGEESTENTTEASLLIDLYEPGQYLVVQVTSVIQSERAPKVLLSIDPKQVNKSLSAAVLNAGHLLQCAISCVEENGYIIETGLPSVRGAFLHKNETTCTYDVGNVFLGTIKSSVMPDADDTLCNLKISALPDDLTQTPVNKKHNENQSFVFPGALVPVTISKIHEDGLEVKTSHGVGVISSEHLITPFGKTTEYVVGSTINARILFVTCLTNVIHFSIQPSICQLRNGLDSADVAIGEVFRKAVIIRSNASKIYAELPNKQIGFSATRDMLDIIPSKINKQYTVGKQVQCRALKFWLMDQTYQVSFTRSIIDKKVLSVNDLKIGDICDVVVTERVKSGVLVLIDGTIKGFIPSIHLGPPNQSNLLVAPGSKHSARLFMFRTKTSPYLTLRKELLDQDKPTTKFLDDDKNSVFGGIIFGETNSGYHIEFFDGAKGFLPKNAITEKLKNKSQSYVIGSFVECCVKKLWEDKNAHLTLPKTSNNLSVKRTRTDETDESDEKPSKKPKLQKKKDQDSHLVPKVKANQVKADTNESSKKVTPIVKATKKTETKKAKVLVHENEKPAKKVKLQKNKDQDSNLITEVKANQVKGDTNESSKKVTPIDKATKKTETKKSKVLAHENEKPAKKAKLQKNKDQDSNLITEVKANQVKDDKNESSKKATMKPDTELSTVQVHKNKEDTQKSIDVEVKSKKVECLDLKKNGFVWNASEILNPGEENSSSSEDEDEPSQKRLKKHNKALKTMHDQEEEKLVRQKEAARLDPNFVPTSIEDFESLLQKNPNSSLSWIQFISYYLESSEVSKAIAVGKRALDSINVTEDNERQNIWKILIKLQVKYGTEQTVSELCQDAIRSNNPLQIYPSIAQTLAEEGKKDDAYDTMKKFLKKNRKDVAAWTSCVEFYFQQNDLDAARELLNKALVSLPNKNHIEVSSRLASLEFKQGDTERGKTIFEKILSNFPKRLDIWNVYGDALEKSGDIDGARRVLQRMAELGVKLQKMNAIFKKMKKLEQKHGTSTSISAVNKRISDYVLSIDN